jgi:hypothetical protein
LPRKYGEIPEIIADAIISIIIKINKAFGGNKIFFTIHNSAIFDKTV